MGEAKRSQSVANGVRGSSVVYVARRRDGREMDAPPFVSVQKYIRRENVCAKKEILSRLSRFAKRVSHGARENTKLFLERKKARKNLKTEGLFSSRFRLSISSLTKKQISHQILSYVYSFKHRLQSPRCAWLKTKT